MFSIINFKNFIILYFKSQQIIYVMPMIVRQESEINSTKNKEMHNS